MYVKHLLTFSDRNLRNFLDSEVIGTVNFFQRMPACGQCSLVTDSGQKRRSKS